MAVALYHQSIYAPRSTIKVSVRGQVIIALLLMLALSMRIFIRVQITDVGYDLARERQRAMQIDMERQETKLTLSFLLRGDNLSEAARAQLGLEPLNPSRARRISALKGANEN